MNKYVAAQVVGFALLALGTQGAVRLLVDHSNTGLLSWLGGFAPSLIGYVVAVLAGVALAWWGQARARNAKS